jgi:hypothetical protein
MGCVKTILFLVLLLFLGLIAYLNRDRIRIFRHDGREGNEVVVKAPSPELAAAADKKLEALRTGNARMVTLTELELQSLLRYKYQALLPAFVDSPQIELAGEKIHVRARVPVDRLPQFKELGEAAAFLPDTTELGVEGKLLPLEGGRVALAIDRVSAARIPLPKRLVPGALKQLGREEEPGLPADAFAIRLPPGASAAYVRGDSLFFLSTNK